MIDLDDHKIIEDTISQIEKTTSGEIRVVVEKESDHYPAAYYRCGIFLALLATFVPLPLDHIHTLLYFQIPLFFLGFILCYFPPIKFFFISKKESKVEVNQRAIQAFFENNLHTTRDRTAILIFVSLLEHQVEILADTGINEKVEKDTWDKTMASLILNIKKKNLTLGLRDAVLDCGKILSAHFPPSGSNPNELPNRPIIGKK